MEEKKLTERLTEYGKKYPTKELNLLRELEDMLDDGELLSKDYHDEQVFHYVDENAELRAEIEKLKVEFKKELSEHEEFTKKAKAEIERLEKQNGVLLCAKDAMEANCIEFQKQVDELKEKLNKEYERGYIFGKQDALTADREETCTESRETTTCEQAVKDTAKEIFTRLAKRKHQGFDLGGFFVEYHLRLEDLNWLKEKYGLEVE